MRKVLLGLALFGLIASGANGALLFLDAGGNGSLDLAPGGSGDTSIMLTIRDIDSGFSFSNAFLDDDDNDANGEVDVTALETALTGTFRFTVRKDMSLRWPRAETPTHFMTMGFDEDLDAAIKIALREMIDFLVKEKGLSRDDAYMLSSTAVDLHITQLVDGKKGIHATVPKAVFTANRR